jgi:hypothetical protein
MFRTDIYDRWIIRGTYNSIGNLFKLWGFGNMHVHAFTLNIIRYTLINYSTLIQDVRVY